MNVRAERLFSFEQTAELLNVSKALVRRWVGDGTIRKVHRLGHRTVRVPESEIARLQKETLVTHA